MPAYFFHLLFELYLPTDPSSICLSELSGLTPQQRSALVAWVPPPKADIFTAPLPRHEIPDIYNFKKHSRQKSKGATSQARRSSNTDRHLDWRFGRVNVESFDMAPPETNEAAKRAPKATSASSIAATPGHSASKAKFVPLQAKNTEFGYGVVHLYRDAYETPELCDPPRKSDEGEDLDEDALKTVAVLAVPTYMTPSDFMGFVGEETRDTVSHFRMVRTGKANRYMVLMKFRNKDGARKFVKDFNGKEFNSMEPENCHVVYLKSIQFTSPSATKSKPGVGVFPEISNDPFSPSPSPSLAEPSASTSTHLSAKPAPPPTPSLLELPTCPVCLERMDETTGLLTILCQHVFHCACLSKWKDSSCPVCRYTQASQHMDPEDSVSDDEDESCCISCGATQNLWICLICGNVGCGRYDEAHAFEHYKSTSHCYAMDIASQRVWDYAGDGYVHRLIQNKSDGKLVELPSALSASTHHDGELIPAEKLENISMEYSHLLTSQLDSQRLYFEEKVALSADKASSATAAAEAAAAEAQALTRSMQELQAKYTHLSQDVVPTLEKEKTRAELKAGKFSEMARRMEKEWKEEKGVNEGLMDRIRHLDKENEQRSSEIKDLKEQLRDLMFFLEAREKMKEADEEIKEGNVVIPEAPKENKKKKGKGRR